MGNRNKKLGNRAEIHYMHEFRELGFEFCKTARNVSTLIDGLGIDLVFVPFNVQIKAGIQKGLNPSKTLYYIYDSLNTTRPFPKTDKIYKRINILIHRKNGTSGKKRKDTDDLVYVSKKDFFNHINKNKIRIPFKSISIEGNVNKDNFPDLICKNYDVKYGKKVILFHKKKTSFFKDYNTLAIMTFEIFKEYFIKNVDYGDLY